MKRILITGAGSYIGTSLEKWLNQWSDQYIIDTVDMIDGTWRKTSFSNYDVVFHVAGIAHVDIKKASEETKKLYYDINQALTIETAEKAKNDGVKQFIFMSSIIVYGTNSSIKDKKVITEDTIPRPSNFYGDSKLQAEKGILPMQSDNFEVVILRPPMIYGQGSKGNYPKLAKLARVCPIFPDIYNQRSMLHIDNLCEFIRLMIENNESGIFYPQNDEYSCTSEMVKMIAELHENKIWLTKIFNPILKIIPHEFISKAFGTVVYEKEMSKYKINYNMHNFKDTLKLTEDR